MKAWIEMWMDAIFQECRWLVYDCDGWIRTDDGTFELLFESATDKLSSDDPVSVTYIRHLSIIIKRVGGIQFP